MGLKAIITKMVDRSIEPLHFLGYLILESVKQFKIYGFHVYAIQ